MTSNQLERHLEAVEAQMRWAKFHDGDHELLNLLRIKSSRLRVKDRTMSWSPDWPGGHDSAAIAIEECPPQCGQYRRDHLRLLCYVISFQSRLERTFVEKGYPWT
jgi:hypothetical protein